MGSIFIFVQNIGILIGYILSSYLHYKLVGMIAVGLPATCVILVYIFLPETPQHLLRRKLEKEAEASFNFYRNKSDKLAVKSLELLQFEFNEMKKVINESIERNDKISFKDFGKLGNLINILILLIILFYTQGRTFVYEKYKGPIHILCMSYQKIFLLCTYI